MLKTNGYVTKTDGYVTGTSGYVWVRQTYPDVPVHFGVVTARPAFDGYVRVRPGTSRVRHLCFRTIFLVRVFFSGGGRRGRPLDGQMDGELDERTDGPGDDWTEKQTDGKADVWVCTFFPTQL